MGVSFSGSCCGEPIMVTHEPTADRLRKIVIPELGFRNAALSDVLNFLHLSYLPVGYTPPPIIQEIGKSSVVYTIPVPDRDNPTVKQPNDQRKDEDNERSEKQLTRFGPSITLKMESVSLMQVFHAVTKACGGTCAVKRDMVVITAGRIKPPPLPSAETSDDLF